MTISSLRYLTFDRLLLPLLPSSSHKSSQGGQAGSLEQHPQPKRLDLVGVFEKLDLDASGALSAREVQRAIEEFGLPITYDEALAFVTYHDADRSGVSLSSQAAALLSPIPSKH
ncbi:unnamed protein product [Chrysoparadoxa australica]